MKYLSSEPFSTPANSDNYRNNFDSVFGPPQLSYSKWKELGCICDNHPASKCTVCRGNCSCHFVRDEK